MDKSKIMLFIIIGLLVALIGTVVGVAVFLMGMLNEENPEDFLAPQQPLVSNTLAMMDLEEISLGDQILTNLATDENGRSGIVRTGVVVLINATADDGSYEQFVTDFTARMGAARSVVIGVFGDLTHEELTTVEGRNAASELIRRRLQETFATSLIIQVRFSDWLLT
jgi:flagellar basal body-associated protein FliL